MRTSLTQAIVKKHRTGDLWIYDTQLRGLVLRVRPSGVNSYLARLGRGKWYTLGRADVLTPEEARELAKGVLGDVAHGPDPIVEKQKARAATLDDFITVHYEPWVVAHRKTGQQTVARLRANFTASFGATKLGEITPFAIERWRSARLKAGKTDATVNRDLGPLKAALQKAVEWRLLDRHPLSTVRLARIDTVGTVRYLNPAEELRLLAALRARDTSRQEARARANQWRRARGYQEWPAHRAQTDLLTPLVITALQTGLRFGELTGLTWADVTLIANPMLTVRADDAKSGKARYVPLNTEAVKALTAWKPSDALPDNYVFPGRAEGERLVEIKTAWARVLKAAAVTGFRFHDLRHTFASKLVQAGVDLNTVRELLGHADIKMTLRYAHLAPEHRAAAVAKLVGA